MPAGRPPALNDVKRGQVCALLGSGFNVEEAARYVGCSSRTLQREIQRNPAFRADAYAAMREAILKPEMVLRQAAGRSWQAAAWLLQRTDPAAYARCQAAVCTSGDLEAFCRWLTDAAMQEVSPDRRGAVYRKLTTIVRKSLHQLAVRSGPRKSLRTPPTLLFDQERMTGPLAPNERTGSATAAPNFEGDTIHRNSVAPCGERGPTHRESGGPSDGQNAGIESVPTRFAARDTIADPTLTDSERSVA